MKVLGYIHTSNDADIISRTIISRTIEALLGQTRDVDEILVVHDAPTDGTLDHPCLQHTAIVRHPPNLETSGARSSDWCSL